MVEIEWAAGALEDLEKLDAAVARRILRKLNWFSRNFDRIVPEPLTGELSGAYKLRTGAWRVIYSLKRKTIIILSVGHRKEVYRI